MWKQVQGHVVKNHTKLLTVGEWGRGAWKRGLWCRGFYRQAMERRGNRRKEAGPGGSGRWAALKLGQRAPRTPIARGRRGSPQGGPDWPEPEARPQEGAPHRASESAGAAPLPGPAGPLSPGAQRSGLDQVHCGRTAPQAQPGSAWPVSRSPTPKRTSPAGTTRNPCTNPRATPSALMAHHGAW